MRSQLETYHSDQKGSLNGEAAKENTAVDLGILA